MSDEAVSERWVFRLRVKNQAGVLAALCAVFAARGISIETVIAHDRNDEDTPYGTVLLTFSATPAKKEYLARLLERSANVQQLTPYRYDDVRTRKSALLRGPVAPETLAGALPPGVLCDVMAEAPDETLAVLLGPAVAVDQALAALSPGVAHVAEWTILVV